MRHLIANYRKIWLTLEYITIWIIIQFISELNAFGDNFGGYKAACGSARECDPSKNLTCDFDSNPFLCTCALHPDENYKFLYDYTTESCVPVLESEMEYFWKCETDLADLGKHFSNRIFFLGTCKSHHECKRSILNSKCNLNECVCECENEYYYNDGNCVNRSLSTMADAFSTLSIAITTTDAPSLPFYEINEISSQNNLSSKISKINDSLHENQVSSLFFVTNGQFILQNQKSLIFWSIGLGATLVIIIVVIICLMCRLESIEVKSKQPQLAHSNSKSDLLQQDSKCIEIQEHEVEIDRKCILGVGKGGIVYSGQYKNTRIAIKTLQPNCTRTEMYLDSLCQEIEIFKQLIHQHENIIKIFGYSRFKFSSTITGYYLLLEFCSFRSLNLFLKKNHFSLGFEASTKDDEYSEYDLLNWSLQIVNGMEFLAWQNIVHGDLATRNVLLTNKNSIKISDFGLARKLDVGETLYIKRTNKLIPWKWSPPEVLEEHKFSIASDIWSFGITLYEIYSLGSEPYENVQYSNKFPTQLYAGIIRPSRPQFASIQIYCLMEKCWKSSPLERIQFSELKLQLNKIIQQPIPPEEHEIGRDGYLIPNQ